MSEARILEGLWWLPETPDQRVAGTLSISETGSTELSLIGSLTSFLDIGLTELDGEKRTVTFTDSSMARAGRYPRILGIAGNSHLTLEDCLQTHRGGILSALESERIRVGVVFVGLHFEPEEETGFNAIYAHMNYFINWLELSGLQESFDPAALKASGRVAELGLSRLKPKRCKLEDGAVLEIGQTFRVGGDLVRSRSINQDFYLGLEHKTLQPLQSLLARLRDFQDLVTIATDRVAGYSEVAVNHPDVFHQLERRRAPVPIEVHAEWHAHSVGDAKAIYAHQMLFTYTEFGGLSGLKRWSAVANQNRSTLSRLMATRYAPGMFLSDQVMNLAAGIEGYDRAKHDDRRQYLARIARCAEYAGHPFKELVGNVDAWSKLLRDARNDIAHDNARLDTTSTNHLALAHSAYFLLVLCLLRDSGASSAVFARLRRHSRFEWVGSQVQALLASEA